MRKIDTVVIHCSASPNFRHTTVTDIDLWHRQRGFRRSNPLINPELTSIGYHYVIYVDGSVHTGRDEREIGAHAAGWNAHSIGICMIGNNEFTDGQWESLKTLVSRIMSERYVSIIGHCDLPNVKKTCPNFNVFAWYADNFMYRGTEDAGT